MVTAEAPFKILLKKGLNLIGNPYNFTISCKDIVEENVLPEGSLKFRQFLNGGFVNEDLLDRYRGAYVYSDSDMEIKIPIINHSRGRKKENYALFPINSKSWEVNLVIDDGEFRNGLVGFGMNPQATAQKDIWDEMSLPMFTGMTSFDMIFRELDDNSNL